MAKTKHPQGSDDSFDLSRFAKAQDADYEQALLEIRADQKRSHWMWYIFPQIVASKRPLLRFRVCNADAILDTSLGDGFRTGMIGVARSVRVADCGESIDALAQFFLVGVNIAHCCLKLGVSRKGL